ncbi:MAG: PEP-CTERM sorting domain-containing protein [Rubripirellula sp.]
MNPIFSAGGYSNGGLLFIVRNDGTDAVTGTFASLNQGDSATTYGGIDWQISYFGDSVGNAFTGGNDIALLAVTAVPEPSSLAVIGLSSLCLLIRRKRRR